MQCNSKYTSFYQPHFIHIAQKHASDMVVPSQKDIDEVVCSQLKVAEVIKKYIGYPVVVEGLTEDGNPEDVFEKTREGARCMFPFGISSAITQLNEEQKKALYDLGAPQVMWFLGEMPSIYKAIHEEVSVSIDSAIDAELNSQDMNINNVMKKMFLEREIEAIKCTGEALKKQQKFNTALVVFGSDHDFRSLCYEYGFSHEKIDAL